MSKVQLKAGDYVRTEGMTEEQYRAVARELTKAGGGKCYAKGRGRKFLFIDSEGDCDAVCNIGVRATRELTIEQVLGEQEPAPTIEQLLAKANRHAAKAAKHERKAAEHEAKRVEAVESARQLMPGYTIEISAKWERDLPEEQPEDMTDPANWKAGDVVECITASIGFGGRESFVMGNKYTVSRNYGGAFLDLAADEYGEANGLAAKNFRWISRPQGESE